MLDLGLFLLLENSDKAPKKPKTCRRGKEKMGRELEVENRRFEDLESSSTQALAYTTIGTEGTPTRHSGNLGLAQHCNPAESGMAHTTG